MNEARLGPGDERLSEIAAGEHEVTAKIIEAATTPPEKTLGVFVGMPAALKLDLFASLVNNAFGPYRCYLVGSATRTKQWRDVDVVYIMEDVEFDLLFGKESPSVNSKWQAMCMAFSALAKEMTGLPVDFKVQQMTTANKRNNGPRMALGMAYKYSGMSPYENAGGGT